MRFFINPDMSGGITGWLCPDDYRAAAVIKVVLDGRATTMLTCTVPYDVLREWGWHETGVCGFIVNDASLPGADTAHRLEIFDPDTNVLLYRRLAPPTHVDRKLFLIGTGGRSETELQAGLYPFFRTAYFDMVNLSDETIRILMTNAKWVDSTLFCGPLVYPRYADLFEHSAIESAILIRDPYESLALRLAALKRRAPALADEAQAWRLGDQREAVAFAAALDPLDRRSRRRLMREMPEAVYHLLANPLTRLLGTAKPDDKVVPGHAATAIEMLARLDIVGHARHAEGFVETLSHHLGIPPLPVPAPVAGEAAEAAEALRRSGDAEFLVEVDVGLSETVAGIVAKQWAS